eukprot:TRINITY_DN1530_c0_g2_i1.p1 TRINITY_DN1530_c0_g2~~TRINITY_DN1530_c0_g2_i1.p1  ORF type:complete len:192 (+),score=60.83 TRINITY_DN1530_c0_g2_i1:241-816(+)
MLYNTACPNYFNGGTPSQYRDYRLYVISRLRKLKTLDSSDVTEEEQKEADRVYSKLKERAVTEGVSEQQKLIEEKKLRELEKKKRKAKLREKEKRRLMRQKRKAQEKTSASTSSVDPSKSPASSGVASPSSPQAEKKQTSGGVDIHLPSIEDIEKSPSPALLVPQKKSDFDKVFNADEDEWTDDSWDDDDK